MDQRGDDGRGCLIDDGRGDGDGYGGDGRDCVIDGGSAAVVMLTITATDCC